MLPSFYSVHHSLHKDDIDFWLSLAKLQGEPILELGCGTGRVTSQLASAGFLTYGLDNRYDMLSYLTLTWPGDATHRARIFQADMTAFHLATHFPLIILPCNTLSTLPVMARLATLVCVRNHLQPGGLFSASIPNPAVLRALPARGEAEIEESFIHPASGNPVQVSSTWERTSDYFLVVWCYDHLLPDGRVERMVVEARHVLIPVNVYLDELRNAGLNAIGIYGDFDLSEYTPDSPYWIIVAGL